MSTKDICSTLVKVVVIGLLIVAMVLWVCWFGDTSCCSRDHEGFPGFIGSLKILRSTWIWKKTKQNKKKPKKNKIKKQGPAKFVNVNKGPQKVLEFYACDTTNN